MSDENVLGILEQKVKLRLPQTAAKLQKRDKQTSKLSKNLIKLDSELRVYLLVEDWDSQLQLGTRAASCEKEFSLKLDSSD